MRDMVGSDKKGATKRSSPAGAVGVRLGNGRTGAPRFATSSAFRLQYLPGSQEYFCSFVLSVSDWRGFTS